MAITDEEPTGKGWVPPDTFASRLVQLRHFRGLSQEAAAELCGLDDGSWSNWENGATPRRQAEVVASIAAALGCNPIWLAWGTEALLRLTYNSPSLGVVADAGQMELPLGIDPPVLIAAS